MDTIECESAEAALATLLIGGREVAMIFAEASSPSGLCEQAGHMTASDFCAARYIFSCRAGGHPHMRRREFIALVGWRAAVWSRTRAAALPTDATDRLICNPRVSQTIG
jgi:hypothetical protein